jgi:ANTH domain
MGTFIYHGSSIFWRNVKDYASLHGNEVVCWKFLVILYRILQDGQASAIKDSLAEIPFIGKVISMCPSVPHLNFGFC